MSTYREIHGKAVKSVSTDPSAETDAGQIWYNTTSDTFKSIINSQAWASAAPTTNLTNNGAGAGTTTAGLTFGGRNPPGPAFVSTTEEYNGAGWAAGGALNTARSYLAGFGIQTAAVAAGGRINAPGTSTNATEEYNGTAWTTVNNMGTTRRIGGSAGLLQTAGLAIGGGPPAVTSNEEYDGTNWSTGGVLNTARFYLAGFGTLTSAVAAGGNGGESAVEEYNGASWTTVNSLGTGRTQLGSSGSSETAGLVFGGEAPGPTVKAVTESYDGTSWTETADLATARRGLSGSTGHSGTNGIAVAGFPTYNLTEEFNNTANIITAAAFSSGTAFPTASSSVAGAGPRDAAIGIGGYPQGSPPTGKSFEYNGVAWSAEATLNPNTGTAGVNSAAGSQTACINSQSNPGPPYPYDAAGEYDGSSWSNANDRPTANYSDASAGTLTAALFFGGAASPSSLSNATLSYDGTNWTVEESMSTTRSIACGNGTSTAALAGGGLSVPSPATNTSNTEIYGGESWTAGGTMLSALREHRSGGPATDCLEFGGRIQGAPPSTFRLNSSTYDGTAWASGPNLATARGLSGSGNGPVGAIWGAAGYWPGPPTGPTGNRTNTTEHFNVETTAINVKTLTQS